MKREVMQPELLAASAQNNKAMSASTHGNEKLRGDSFVPSCPRARTSRVTPSEAAPHMGRGRRLRKSFASSGAGGGSRLQLARGAGGVCTSG